MLHNTRLPARFMPLVYDVGIRITDAGHQPQTGSIRRPVQVQDDFGSEASGRPPQCRCLFDFLRRYWTVQFRKFIIATSRIRSVQFIISSI